MSLYDQDPNGIFKMPLVHKNDALPIIDWNPDIVKYPTKETTIHFWEPKARTGYGCVGSVITLDNKEPDSNLVYSVPLSNLKVIKENELRNIWNNLPNNDVKCNIWENRGFLHAQSNWNKPKKIIYGLNYDTIKEERDISDTKQEILLKFIPKNVKSNLQQKIVNTLASKLDIVKSRIKIKELKNDTTLIQINERAKSSVEKPSEEIVKELSTMVHQNILVKENNSNVMAIINHMEVIKNNPDMINII